MRANPGDADNRQRKSENDMYQPDEWNDARRERRGSTRVHVASDVRGFLPNGTPVALLNVNAGGLMLQSSIAMTAGETYRLAFERSGDLRKWTFDARVVHMMRVTRREGPAWVVGLEFAPTSTLDGRAIEALVAYAAAAV